MFYHFCQNNSGGTFDRDHKSGISHHVIVEGTDADDIVSRAEAIGLYWDGCQDGRDCSCCGDRWYRPLDNLSLDTVPRLHDQNVSDGVYTPSGLTSRWIKDGPEGYIHYMDGRVIPIEYGPSK